MGKLIEVWNEPHNKKVQITKLKKGYRVTGHEKKTNRWIIAKSYETIYKKYAERRFVDTLQELF